MPGSFAFAVCRRSIVLLLAVIAMVTVPMVARAQPATPSGSGPSASASPTAEDQVVLSGAVIVPKGSSVGEIVVFHGRVQIAGSVQGDVVIPSPSTGHTSRAASSR